MKQTLKLWLVVTTYTVACFLMALPFALIARLYVMQLSQLLNSGVSYWIAVPLTAFGVLLSGAGIFAVVTSFEKWFGKTQFVTKIQ